MLFISPEKLFSFARYLNFCLDFLVKHRNGSVRKKELISKFMTSQPEKQTITIYILPNISRSNSNQAIKLGQLIEYSMRNIFLDKSYTKCGETTIPRPFSENQTRAHLQINSRKFYAVYFYCMLSITIY